MNAENGQNRRELYPIIHLRLVNHPPGFSCKIKIMDHFQQIYTTKARAYHRMIAAEDVDGHLIHTLREITDWTGKKIYDLGSGTGRFPLIFRDAKSQFVCLDLYRAMLIENRRRREEAAGAWPILQGDMRRLPFPAKSADIAIAGWAIGHLRSWCSEDWHQQIGGILTEMLRVVKSGGCAIICETMSTGSLVPQPPVDELAQYYDWLEAQHGFSKIIIQTDYQFAGVDQAVAYTEFFFGSDLSERIQKNGWSRLPEWTGVWYRYV